MSDTRRALDALISPQEQAQLVSRASATHALQGAAYMAYARPIPATQRVYDEALTVARKCGLTRDDIRQTINEARKEALHGW